MDIVHTITQQLTNEIYFWMKNYSSNIISHSDGQQNSHFSEDSLRASYQPATDVYRKPYDEGRAVIKLSACSPLKLVLIFKIADFESWHISNMN
jgi:hypothetical protein